VTPATIVRERPQTLPVRRAEVRQSLHVIGEDMFRGVLIRERKRADRSNESFAVIVLEMPGDSRPSWWHAIEALAAVKRDMDIIGWLKRERVLALMLPSASDENGPGPRALEENVRAELAKRLEPATLCRVSIGVHVHSAAPATQGQSESVEPLLMSLKKDRLTLVTAAGKRALDIVGSLALLAVLSPVLLVVAALVKFTSAGPILFRQTRVGEHGKPFKMLKFRTMRVNADDRLHREYVASLIAAGQQGTAAKDGVFKITNDPRITPVGRFLRRTSLDELPQFINVLLGSMSLVGPRPPIPYEVEQYKPWHHRRVLDAKPGITGLWQVTGRSRTSFDDMVRLDLRYARRCSLWTDIKILLATPGAVFSGKGAC
jgi:exopolysaccharide biosynthesis polyprenyl glycosylphosphotransferase